MRNIILLFVILSFSSCNKEEIKKDPIPIEISQKAQEILSSSNQFGFEMLQKAFEESGIQVGVDVSVVGFDDVPAALMVKPSLTTVSQPICDVGYNVARLLIGMIEGEDVKSVVLPTKLVVRESTVGGATVE